MSDVQLSRKGERNLSAFIGQELLYDYIRGELDEERKIALEKQLESNRDLKLELEKIREGWAYVTELRETQISPALMENIRVPSTYLHVLLQKTRFTDWPEGVKLAVEAVAVGAGGLLLVLLIPWGKVLSWKTGFEQTSVVLTEVTKTKSSDPDRELSPEAPGANEPLLFEDEGRPGVQPASTNGPSVETPQVPMPPVAAAKTESSPKPASEPKAMATAAPDAVKKQGFLYRGSIKVTNVAAVSEKLIEYITTAGGRKAGEVELGWKKGSGSYFHFTVPEAKYKAMTEFFNEYGHLRIQKEPHPRVMPDGIVRVIVTVDEK